MAIITNPTHSQFPLVVTCERNMVVNNNGTLLSFNDIDTIRKHCIITDFIEEKEFAICAIEIQDTSSLSDIYTVMTIRQFFAENDEQATLLVSRAKALINWRKNTQYCSICGSKLKNSLQFTAMECPNCKKIHFPRIEPCIIVLVNKGNKILLARHVQRNQDIYACIAGFMEAGETAEHAVQREILEETGLTVKNITYRGSQSWPFPSQLMLGFTAEYESGEIHTQEEEISDAQWFDRDTCPATPQPGSIAYKLIHQEY